MSGVTLSSKPCARRKMLPTDEFNLQMLALLLELLRSEAESLPALAVGGLWYSLVYCIMDRPAVAQKALGSGIMALSTACVRAIEPVDRSVRLLSCIRTDSA